MHALIDAGGHDLEFLNDEQLARAEGRLDADRYAAWFSERPRGDPPGELYVHEGGLVVAGLRAGNLFLGIQPPRGFGENPIASYHHPDLPPTHHYLAAYWWLEHEFGADAVVHLGKHGPLEWLPGKSLGLSAACAPDAALGSLPLFYPFIVNDPGEGTQAKRRAHAVVVDHLVPPMMRTESYDEPMMRTESYDELARLEQLLEGPGSHPSNGAGSAGRIVLRCHERGTPWCLFSRASRIARPPPPKEQRWARSSRSRTRRAAWRRPRRP